MDNKRKNIKPLSKNIDSDRMNSLVYGKIAPQSPQLEAAVLGAIMLEPESLSTVMRFLQSPDCFYSDANQRIFVAIQDMYQRGMRLDFMTVCEELRKTKELENVGGAHYVTNLTRDVVSSARIVEHSMEIVERYIERELIRMSGAVISDAYDDSMDVFLILQNLKTNLYDIQKVISKFRDTPFSKQLSDTIAKIEAGKIRTNVKTYFEKWDNANGGALFAGVHVLAGRPSAGKSTLMLEVAYRQMKHDHKVGIWSGEMEYSQVITRMLSKISEIPAYKLGDIKNLNIDELARLEQATQELAKLNPYINDEAKNVFELCELIRYWVRVKGVEVVWIDYLRLLKKPDGVFLKDKTEEASFNMEQIRLLTRELGIPIHPLSQMNRDVESRTGDARQPRLSDLKSSGEIEESAHSVAFFHRPEKDNPDPMLSRIGVISIRKSREGKLIDIECETELSIYSIKERERTFIDLNKDIPFEAPDLPSNSNFNKGMHTRYEAETKTDNEKNNDLPFD